MYIKQGISVGNLLLDLGNYRHGKQPNQKSARDAIIAEQGRKLVRLAEDIVAYGLNPFDLPMVVDAEDGNQNFIVVEGNRRLTAINLMLEPTLASGTPLHKAFVRLNKNHADAIPKVFDCVIAPNKAAARTWIDRKHANGLEGAGTEHWSAMAKARADVDAGESRADLDVVNFVLGNPNIDNKLRAYLEGGDFSLTTLQRLVTTKNLQEAAGFELNNGKLIATSDKNWLQGVLTDLVTTIASGKRNDTKFTERDIDSQDKRESFVNQLVADHPGKKKAKQAWSVTGMPAPKAVSAKPNKASTAKGTTSTDEQPNLISKKFRLDLPSGKINDIFIELKTLNVTTYRHSVAVLFRVFIEFSLNHYISKHSIKLPTKNNQIVDSLSARLTKVLEHVKNSGLLTPKELKPINVAISAKDSMLAPDTLNAYVHSHIMNPDPLKLKLAWADIQHFLEQLWVSKNSAGQN